MRPGIYPMLLASAALHVAVVMTVALVHFHGGAALVMASVPTGTPNLILLRSEENLGVHAPAAVIRNSPASVPPAEMPVSVPSPTRAPTAEIRSAIAPPASFALEANPNAHIRELPPEEILSPKQAPHLDGRDGLVFILDISGSMYESYAGSTRLALARQAMSRRIRGLKDGTPFAVTVYAETARNSGPLVPANNLTREAAVRFIAQDINCGGGTNLPAGLASATELGTGRLVLVSDGDLNMTPLELKAKTEAVLGPEGRGPALLIIGIAPRPRTKDGPELQELADAHSGAYHVEAGDDTEMLTANRATTTTP